MLGHVRQSNGAGVVAIHSSDLGVDFRPGPLSVRWVARERWLLGSGDTRVHDAGLVGSEVRAGLPLVATFESRKSHWVHWVEPFLVGTAALRGYGSAYGTTPSRPVATAQAALLNLVHHEATSTNASLQLRGGVIAESNGTSRALAARSLAAGNWLAVGGDIGWADGYRWMSVLRSRVGRADRVALRARLEGRGARQPTEIRWLFDEGWNPWCESWFQRQGWVAGADVDLALGAQVALSAGTVYDVGHSSLVGESLGVSYRHPCGCFAANSRADWRVGRGGLDVLVLLELMP